MFLRRSLGAVLAALLVAGASSVLASGAMATEAEQPEVVGIQLVGHPDQAHLGRRGMVSIVGQVAAGSTISRELIVSNDTREVQELAVYVSGAKVTGDGFVPDADEEAVASWSSISEPSVRLESGGRSTVQLVIDVPRDAVDGEHYAHVWVQPPASEGAIRQINRVGIRIYLTTFGGSPAVDGPVGVTDEVDFVIESMTAARLEDGRPRVRAEVRNLGPRAIDLIGDLDLSEGPGGTRAGPFPTDGVTTVPIGGRGTVLVTLAPDVPAGPWLARLVLVSGVTERAAEALVEFPLAADTSADPVPAEMTPVERQRRVLLPIAGTLWVTVLTILLVLLVGRRRGRKDDDGSGGVASSAASPENEPAPQLSAAP